MKKILLALCAVSLLGLTACKKDKVSPDEPTYQGSGNNGNQTPGGGGTPAAPETKIAQIDFNDALYETWNWQDNQLKSVNDANGSEKVSFTYDGQGRVASMTVNGNSILSGTVNVGYNSVGISELTVVRSGMSVIKANIDYSGGKMSRADVDIDSASLMSLFNAILPQILASYFPNIGDMLTPDMGLSNTVDSIVAYITFDWRNSENVQFTKIEISARLNTTLGQIAALANGNYSIFGQYANMVEQMAESNPDQEIHLITTINDKGTYRYDNNPNPFRNYLGDLVNMKDYLPAFNVASVSTNNIDTEEHQVNAKVSVSTTVTQDVPIVGPIEVPVTIPVVDKELYNTTVSYTYTYREGDGYPLTVTDSDDNTKKYTYQAK